MTLGSTLLLAGGALSAAAALLHLVVIGYGAPAYRYFGAGEQLATMAENRSPLPALLTLGITAALAGFAACAFAGAGMLTLPWARTVILAIGALYSARGIALVPVLLVRRHASRFDVVSSLVALVTGIAYLAGGPGRLAARRDARRASRQAFAPGGRSQRTEDGVSSSRTAARAAVTLMESPAWPPAATPAADGTRSTRGIRIPPSLQLRRNRRGGRGIRLESRPSRGESRRGHRRGSPSS